MVLKNRFRKKLGLAIGGLLTLGMVTTGAGVASADTVVAPETVSTEASIIIPDNPVTTVVESGTTTIKSTTPNGEGDLSISLPGSISTPKGNVPSIAVERDLFSGIGAPVMATRLANASIEAYETKVGTQSIVTIDNAKASKTYKFELDVPAGTSPELTVTGAVNVVDAEGTVVSGFVPPWAYDAHGDSVPTHFTLEGNTLVQTVDFSTNNAFPIVADPTSIQWVPWPVFAIDGVTLRVVATVNAAIFVGGSWAGCVFSKLSGVAGKVLTQICAAFGITVALNVLKIVGSTFKNTAISNSGCYGINISNPSAALRTMPHKDCWP
ncbi:hypothetical protein [Arthrobacter sp. ERGS1:01]|uniref:hypothetical protein n=1 Tax=Arthrobacter sp. ERGS1:01 TaxID=1704044 RepID=UPI000B1F6161|nr:hypothetical protein [Arthrobacter sp. ERGS1:01]